VVILGGGIQGCATAYYLSKRGIPSTIVERVSVAAAASGTAGGFLAGGWGDRVTEPLHAKSAALHEALAEELALETYRKIPTLSVAGGDGGGSNANAAPPPVSWLDGDVRRAELMDDTTAQVTPMELTTRLHEEAMKMEGARTVYGEAESVALEPVEPDDADSGERRVVGVVVKKQVAGGDGETITLPCDVCVVAMGPWSTRASAWFGVDVPMTGVKSVSLEFPASDAVKAEPAALFCAEDRNGCHLEVYPRSTGEVYICGCGGSEYVDEARLMPGGDLDSADKMWTDETRVKAASDSFGGLSRSVGRGGPAKTQSCMRPCPPDARPIIGAVPGVRGAYMNCGHNCWGILWAPISGKVVSELVADGEAVSVDLTHFAPGRFMTAAQKRGRKMRDVNVGEQW
jgi:glycine/D-amino acid oxidase-like deaminating enzyme